jgi:hypothetical protein
MKSTNNSNLLIVDPQETCPTVLVLIILYFLYAKNPSTQVWRVLQISLIDVVF